MNIPYGTQYIEEDDIDAVVRVLRSDFLTTGSEVNKFEQKLCGAIGSRYAVAVSSGTAALHLAVMVLGLSPGDEVILSPLTFAASANCVLYCGGRPVFSDIDSDTLLMDADGVKKKITAHTKAIIAVHYGGECCDMEALSDLSSQYNIPIIQDAAHSLGSLAYGKKLGAYDGMQAFSFHPVKTITTGEGGAVTTNDERLYKKLCRLRTHGITREAKFFEHENEGDWYYEQIDLGYNYRITDIQCALGISQLNKLEQFSNRRVAIVKQYDDAFAKLPLVVQQTPSWSTPVRHLYTIQVRNPGQRKAYFDRLRAKGIGANVHYQPIYLMPYYRNLGYEQGLCPVAENAYSCLITLPLYPSMTDEQVCYVIDVVEDLFS